MLSVKSPFTSAFTPPAHIIVQSQKQQATSRQQHARFPPPQSTAKGQSRYGNAKNVLPKNETSVAGGVSACPPLFWKCRGLKVSSTTPVFVQRRQAEATRHRKKNVLRTDRKPEDAVQNKISSRKDTKENKPAVNKGSQSKPQSVLQSLQSPVKSRSPLSDNSMLIQEGNEADTTSSESKLKKDIPSEIKCDRREAKEQKTSSCPEMGEKASEQQEQKETTVDRSKDNKVPASKNRSRTGPKKKTENKAPQNKKVTDYYPIRRSNRKTKAELKNEEHKHIDDLIKNGVEDGMKIEHIEGKGRGVFAVNGFKKGDFVVEYHGDLLDLSEAKLREAQYSQDPSTGCYMYYFQYQTKTYCVDATKESSRLGRLINHSKTGNCQTRLHPIDGTPHLILVASRDIEADEELLYDYGDRSKDSISAHPWLKH